MLLEKLRQMTTFFIAKQHTRSLERERERNNQIAKAGAMSRV